ncbi:transposase [Plantactinospora sp. WMMB782]|uniref:transposase n=1 Tax=Plantactinospora sp. WMMB782 TaxID=3404121 RepID=UPI003B95D2D8
MSVRLDATPCSPAYRSQVTPETPSGTWHPSPRGGPVDGEGVEMPLPGRQPRMVPHDLAPGDAAYRWFRRWSVLGVWDQIHDALRDAVRAAEGRDPQPSAAVPDAQSAKSSCGGQQIGFDAGERVRGRRRHLLVDTNGLLLAHVVHSAGVQDRAGAKLVLTGITARYPHIGPVWSDGGYADAVDATLIDWARSESASRCRSSDATTTSKAFRYSHATGSWSSRWAGCHAVGAWTAIMSGCRIPHRHRSRDQAVSAGTAVAGLS